MSHARTECLHEGLLASSNKSELCKGSMPWMLGSLEYLAAALIEGDKQDKKIARADLKKLISHGRCILNAADLAKNNCMNCTVVMAAFRMPCDPINLGGQGVCTSCPQT